jgi:hypothetical protein
MRAIESDAHIPFACQHLSFLAAGAELERVLASPVTFAGAKNLLVVVV